MRAQDSTGPSESDPTELVGRARPAYHLRPTAQPTRSTPHFGGVHSAEASVPRIRPRLLRSSRRRWAARRRRPPRRARTVWSASFAPTSAAPASPSSTASPTPRSLSPPPQSSRSAAAALCFRVISGRFSPTRAPKLVAGLLFGSTSLLFCSRVC